MPNFIVVPLMAALVTAAVTEQQSAKFTHFAGFELGKATLAEVQKSLGPSALKETGHAGEYEARVCYSLSDGKVEFASDELGGNSHDLQGFTVSLQGCSQTCARWPTHIPAPALQIGDARLGMSEHDFAAVFKTPVQRAGRVVTAQYEYQRQPTSTELAQLPEHVRIQAEKDPSSLILDIAVSVEGTFDHGRLVKLAVWKSQTY